MHADIFCKRVDNYGDIGVCWRLARRLRQAGGWRVRLWIDELAAFARMEPRCVLGLDVQDIDDIAIVSWSPDAPVLEPGEVVIEAFACDPPEAFRLAMRRRPPIWINLEYLSAEPWVESHHKLPSPQPDGLMKYFFFPGFTPATGGLLREPDLGWRRDQFRRSPDARRTFLAGLGVPSDVAARCTAASPRVDAIDSGETAYAHQARAIPNRPRVVTLFCYADAPLAGLVSALARDPTPSLLLVPEGVAPGVENLSGASAPQLHIARVPFLPQDDYDRLLWCADLNLVRGEDSVVRAGWAARPLVWQIYPQDEGAHLGKLDAWLDRYQPPLPARGLIHAWNTGAHAQALAAAWQEATAPAAWRAWEQAAQAWDAQQSAPPDLAAQLIQFCAELRQEC
jgi:uncharacterized repeat protein (TIGR03837 family)